MIRNDFPVFSSGFTRAMADAPPLVMLDGQEVVFDKLVGLAPVNLAPRKGKPEREEP
ncbi:MAG: hypothetical protein IT361_11395 [Gemmatimonadaceae bacterium]|nr:hypothetical protein [Gemmatimonadaceae bacterium]